ncbi:MAG: isopentenyl phosphate kinase [Patescibacteria group bacterium]
MKLGGSIITKKNSGRPQIKKTVVKQLAKELKLFTGRFPKNKLILLHGAGSFGHPLVYKHKLLEMPLAGTQLLAFSEIIRSMRHMANLLTDIFRSAKLPILPIQTSAILNQNKNKLSISNAQQLKQVLSAGFIPLLGGDMGLTKKNKTIVVSADKLAVLLTETFSISEIVFATDVDGVFEEFPPPNNIQPFSLLYRKNLKRMLKKMSKQKNQYDVTGGMAGKLQTLLDLKEKKVIIFNGLKSGNLIKALMNKPVGTRIIL